MTDIVRIHIKSVEKHSTLTWYKAFKVTVISLIRRNTSLLSIRLITARLMPLETSDHPKWEKINRIKRQEGEKYAEKEDESDSPAAEESFTWQCLFLQTKGESKQTAQNKNRKTTFFEARNRAVEKRYGIFRK